MNHLVYKEYRATVEFDGDDHILVGRILGLNDIVGFHAEDAKAIEAAFHEAVEDYLDACAKIGKKPEREYSGNVMVRIAPGVHASAALAAQSPAEV